MPVGYIILIAVSLLVVFGVAQRVLDRMRLTDRQALLVVAAIFVGSLIPDIPLGGNWSINIGGALVPLALCIYLFAKADTAGERWRAIASAVLGAGAVLLIGWFLPSEPEAMFFDVNYLYGIVAGIIACILGRSRRSAFIGGAMGVLLADVTQGIINAVRGTPTGAALGGAGALDAVIISALLATLISEGVGEIRERLQGGSDKRGEFEFEEGEFVPAHGRKHDDEDS